MQVIRRGVLAALAAPWLQGCTSLGAFNALTPKPLRGRRAQAGVPYGPLPRQRLDVYRPSGGATGLPVLVFFYGGSWEEGAREEYAFVGRAYAARGFVTLVADYRLTGEARYPGFLEDCALAVAWAQRNVAEYGGDGRATVLVGHSAGAYNAAMLALDPRWLAGAGAPHPLVGWAGLSGPYDFLPLSPGPARRTFGDVVDTSSTQPITFASAGDPPAFLACGQEDRLVSPRNTQRLAERLRAVQVPVRERVYPGAGHAAVVLAMAWPLSLRLPVLRESAEFLHAAVSGRVRADASEALRAP